MSGPYGEFHPHYGTGREMIWVGGGAGMAPLRAQIMHLLKTLHVRDREMHYFYGARAIDEVFFMEDFLALEKEYPNFHFHLALDRPDPKADSLGVKYTAGFIALAITLVVVGVSWGIGRMLLVNAKTTVSLALEKERAKDITEMAEQGFLYMKKDSDTFAGAARRKLKQFLLATGIIAGCVVVAVVILLLMVWITR